MAISIRQCLQLTIVVIAIWFSGQGSAIEIKAEPESFNPLLNDKLVVTCTVANATAGGRVFITLSLGMEAKKLGVLVQDKVQKSGTKDNMEITGGAQPDGAKFVRATITNPGEEDAGNYTCAMTYLELTPFNSKTDTVFVDVAFVKSNDSSSVTMGIVTLVRALKKQVEAQGELIAQQNKTIQEKEQELHNQIMSKIDELTQKEKNNSLKIQACCNKGDNDTSPTVPNDVTKKVSDLEKSVQHLENVTSMQNSTIQALEQQLKEQEKVSMKLNELADKEKNNSLKIEALSNKDTKNDDKNTTAPAIPKEVTTKISNLEKTVQELEDTVSQQNTTLHMQGKQLKKQEKDSMKMDELADRERNNSLKIEALSNKDQNKTKPVNPLAKNVTELEKTLQEHEDFITQQNITIQALGRRMKQQVMKIQELAAKDANNSLEIQSMSTKGSIASAFSAGYNAKDTFISGQTMLFTEPIFSVGDAYNTTTGVFTAPQKGLYVFHLTLTTGRAQWNIQADLKVNGNIKATLFAWDDGITDQSSVSTVVSLGVGEQLMPVVRFASGGNTVYADNHFSVFSGYLLQQL